ncbi:MAG: hypothetical protein HC768_22945 [Acaryochloris sp. CRU_2_0]|nr:hypothetical protein [Acaryochloris sp. CRU_2_0]
MSLQKLSPEINFPVPIETVDLDEARDILLEEEIDPFELELLLKILYSVPMAEFHRYQELIGKREALGKLTQLEQSEIRSLLGLLDRYAIERNQAIMDLARFRKIPAQQLIEELKALEEEKAERVRRRTAALALKHNQPLDGESKSS